MKKPLLALGISAFTASTMAMQPLPKEAGFSAFVGAGAAGGVVESNFLAEIVGIDLSNDKIYNYDSPNNTTIIIPNFKLALSYLFSNEKTAVTLNNAIESSLDFTSNMKLGLRHDFDNVGNIEVAGLLGNDLVGLKVWEDPYLQGQSREATDYKTSGGMITWDKMFGSDLELIVKTLKVDLDDEQSGQSLGLSSAQRDLLDREGNLNRAELGYQFVVNGGEYVFRPSVAYLDRDLDGDAMAQDGFELGVAMVYSNPSYSWANKAVYQRLDGDKDNPIFLEKNDADVYMFSSEVTIPEPMGWEKWVARVGVVYAQNDASINFNKSKVAMLSANLGRSF